MDSALSGAGAAKGLDKDHRTSHKYSYHEKNFVDNIQEERMECETIPLNGFTNNGPYDFEIPALGDTFLDMHSIKCHAVVTIDHTDNTVIAKAVSAADGKTAKAAEDVSIVNGFGLVLWQKVEAFIDATAFPGQSAEYAGYKNMMETILTASAETREYDLPTSVWEEDKVATFDDVTNSGANSGYKARAKILTEETQQIEVISNVYHDLLRADNNLPAGYNLTLRLTPQSTQFLLLGGIGTQTQEKYRMKFTDLRLIYNRIRLRDGQAKNFMRSGYMRFICPCTELVPYPIATGLTRTILPIHRGKQFPTQIVVGQVETGALSGRRDKNPFNFQPFNLKQLSLRVNGNIYPPLALQRKWSDTVTLTGWQRMYQFMKQNLGMWMSGRSNMITPELFQSNLFLIPFDLTPDGCNGLDLHDMPDGRIELELVWEGIQSNPITVLVYKLYQQGLILNPKNSPHAFEVGRL